MNHSIVLRTVCVFLIANGACLLTVRSIKAQIPTIELTALSRCIGQAASSFPVQVAAGAQLEEVSQLVFSHPEIVSKLQTLPARLLENEPRPNFGNFDVTIGSDVPPGVYEVRALGRFGLSNPRAFLVTRSPVQYSEQEHSSLATAIDLSQQQMIFDRAFPQRRNYYRLDLATGDQVALVAHGRRLDSRCIVAMTLVDPNGKEVARSRGIEFFPSEIRHVAKSTGAYTLIAYDFLFQGGPDYFYALQAMVIGAGSAGPADCELARLCADPAKKHSILGEDTSGQRKPAALDPAAVTATWLTTEHRAYGTVYGLRQFCGTQSCRQL
jgi:hypothetical protein